MCPQIVFSPGRWPILPYALTPNTVELIPTLGAPFLCSGLVQDPVLTYSHYRVASLMRPPLARVLGGT